MKLHHRAMIKGINGKLAMEQMERFIDAKMDDGFRLRVIGQDNWLEISANSHQMFRTGMRRLKELGYIKSVYNFSWTIIPENKRLNYER